jgi:hypothetical protein
MKAKQMVEENQFFREATLKICGSLEIEKALTKVLLYLRQFMPADGLCLNVYDPALGVIELVTGAGDFVRNIPFPFRMPLSQAEKKIIEDGRIPQVEGWIFE